MNENDVLPADFDGVFRFTNFTDKDFKAKWNNVEYTFPKMSTSPMVMPFSPQEIQSIRKKFARELAILCWYGTEKFKGMDNVPAGGTPALYTDSDLAPFVQRCLEPLPIAQVKAQVLERDGDRNLRKDAKGKNVTRVVEPGDSLMGDGSSVVA